MRKSDVIIGTLGVLGFLLFITFQIINIIGYTNITKFAFESNTSGENRSITLTNSQMIFIKISIIIQIITILSVFAKYIDSFRDTYNSKNINTFTMLMYILYTIGLIFITKFGFSSEQNNDERTVSLTDTEMIFVKITAIMQWFSIVFISIILIIFFIGLIGIKLFR
jgi:hypothetical protein